MSPTSYLRQIIIYRDNRQLKTFSVWELY